MQKKLLHAGCGTRNNKPPREFAAYKEVRLDANPRVDPDIIASIVAMPMVEDNSFDAIFCSHCLEHLYCHEVPASLREFYRILKPGGEASIQVPDLQAIGGKLALDQADYSLYMSPHGPITALDVIYGMRSFVGAGNIYMAHHTGFTKRLLEIALNDAGFKTVQVERSAFELKAVAVKEESHASEEPSPEGVSSEPFRDQVDAGSPLRQQREVAQAR